MVAASRGLFVKGLMIKKEGKEEKRDELNGLMRAFIESGTSQLVLRFGDERKKKKKRHRNTTRDGLFHCLELKYVTEIAVEVQDMQCTKCGSCDHLT